MSLNKKRKFILGDEWLYFKLYSGLGTLNKILKNEVFEITSNLYKEGLIDKFFFVRYSDNYGHHIRLRFHCPQTHGIIKVIELINKTFSSLADNRVISKLVADTYVRELERYSPENISYLESLFSINSWEILNYMQQENYLRKNNWFILIKIFEQVLEDLGLSLDEKHHIYETAYQLNFKKMGYSLAVTEILKAKYRQHRNEIDNSISDSPLPNGSFENVSQQKTILDKIKSNLLISSTHTLERTVIDIFHMSFNRYFTCEQNTYETVIYYMMSANYKSRVIRKKKSANLIL